MDQGNTWFISSDSQTKQSPKVEKECKQHCTPQGCRCHPKKLLSISRQQICLRAEVITTSQSLSLLWRHSTRYLMTYSTITSLWGNSHSTGQSRPSPEHSQLQSEQTQWIEDLYVPKQAEEKQRGQVRMSPFSRQGRSSLSPTTSRGRKFSPDQKHTKKKPAKTAET